MLSRENRKIAFDMVKEAVQKWKRGKYTYCFEYSKDNMVITIWRSLIGNKVSFYDFKTQGTKIEFRLNIIEKITLTYHRIVRNLKEARKEARKKAAEDNKTINAKFETISERFLRIRGE